MADLTTLDAVRIWLEFQSADPSRDEKLQAIIPRVSGWFEGQVGRHIVAAEYTRTFDGTGRPTMLLPEYPILAVRSLKVDGRTIPARAAVGSGGHVLVDGGGVGELALEGGIFCRGVQNVEVTWTGGYATVPPDIEQAVLRMVALDLKEGPRIGLQSESSFGNNVSFLPSVIPQAVKDVIARYRSLL